MSIYQPDEKKSSRITELTALISVIISFVIAGTYLLNFSGNIPLWWFFFSFILLIVLVLVMLLVVFSKPIFGRIKESNLKRKRNSVSEKHFSEFVTLVDAGSRFKDPIRQIANDLKNHYTNEIKCRLTSHVLGSINGYEIQHMLFYIDYELKDSNKSFHDLSLIMNQFESVLSMYEKNLKIIEEFVHEIINSSDKPIEIAKGIEANFMDFREKYNDFLKDFKDYCVKVNREIGEHAFPSGSFDYIKEW